MATSQPQTQLPIFTINEYRDPDFPRKLIRGDITHGDCYVVIRKQKVKMSIRLAILNFLCWRPLFEYGLEPSISEVFNFKSITTDSLSKVHTVIYERLLNAYPNIDDEYFVLKEQDPNVMPSMEVNPDDFKPKGHMKFVSSLAKNVQDIENFIKEMIPGYWPSIDGLALAKLTTHPNFKDLVDVKYDENLGTQVLEQQIKANSAELLRRLRLPIAGNYLYPYMTANALKANQIGQNILCFGTRSDVDDVMSKHIIQASAFSGLSNVREFALESLSAKKATYLLRHVTSSSQYFGRKLRLACSTQPNLYRGNCGSQFTMPVVIDEKYAEAYLDKMIIDSNEPVILTKGNIKNYVNKELTMISPFGCNHHDGICERCAGYGKGRLVFYLPLGIHLGIYAAMQIIKRITQRVLSAKHLIATKSLMYELSESLLNYMMRRGDKIYWNEKMAKDLHKFSIKIPSDALGPLVDLGFRDIIPTPEVFSKIAYWYLMKDDQVVDVIQMEQESFIPFIAEPFLQYMHDHYSDLVIDDDGITVSLKDFNPKNEVFQYTIINDDLISFTNRISAFMGSSISDYTDLVRAMADFSSLVFTKAPDTPYFYLEVVLRNFLITNEKDYTIPTVTDAQHVKFDKLSGIISNSTVCQKLAFENLHEYLSLPSTATQTKPAGIYAPFFGIVG